MSICVANKRDGTPCTLSAQPDNEYCWAHAPENAEHRKRTASKAGGARANSEIGTIKRRLREVAEGVLDGSVDKGKGSVSFQGFGVLIRAIETERKIREQEEILERIEQLEQASLQQKGGFRWG
jgi:hypothetical protein